MFESLACGISALWAQQIPRIVGIAWYERENYDELRRLFADGNTLPERYEDWLKLAENGINNLSGQGLTVEKVDIDPNTFPSWCKARGVDLDSKARMRFASESVARRYLNKNR